MQPSSSNRHAGRHELVNPPDLPAPVGFSHAVVAAPGKLVFLGGHIGCDRDGRVASDSLVEQFDQAAANVVRALSAAGATPEDLVQMLIYVTSAEDYRANLRALGECYRRHFGRHYAASALFEVSALFDPQARVELVCTVVVPAAG